MDYDKNNLEIIAEIGVNHNGDFERAIKLIEAAKISGATAVKFQSFKTEKLAKMDTPKVEYQLRDKSTRNHFEMLKRLELTADEQSRLFQFCAENDIKFISTPYDVESAQELLNIGVECFKVASADIIDKPLLDFLSSTGRGVILSTGMAEISEIKAAINCFDPKVTNYSLLHCVSNYPCSEKSLNLQVINTLRDKFKCEVGFSDHAEEHLPSQIALSLGSRIFERHFTLNKSDDGPDHYASDEPDTFREYVIGLHRTLKILGKKEKRVQEEEQNMRKISRKSLYWVTNKNVGEIITENDFSTLRPGIGISPMDLSKFVHEKLTKNVNKNNLVKLGDIE